MRRFAIVLLALPTIAAFAQQDQQNSQPPPEQNAPGPNILTSLAQTFFHGDFVNFHAGISGLYDSNQAVLNSGIPGSFGFSLSGGVQAYHRFRESELSLSYNAAYSHYQGGGYLSGTNQNLGLLYSTRLSPRWNLGFVESAGEYRYGIGYYGQPYAPTPALANPFSPVTRFLLSGVSLSYRQTARLTYTLGGDFHLARYSYPGAIGNTGVSGSASVEYRLTGRTTVGGTYAHSYYTYQQGAGNATLDGGYFNISHQFAQYWTATASGGVTRSDSAGIIRIPVSVILNGQTITGYEVGPYKLTKMTPSVQGSVSRRLRRTVATVSAGQSVSPGNGVYLASTNRFISGSVSYSMRRANISAGGGWFHLTSLANTIATGYSTGSFGASYSYTLTRYIAANARYEYFRYGNISSSGGVGDNRISFGVTFTSKGIPMTLY